MYRILLCSLWLSQAIMLFGQKVVIQGVAPEYAGKELVFFCYPEPVTREPVMLAETRVEATGRFFLTFQKTETVEIYADLGKFRGSLVAEPGKQYEVSLPPFSPRTPQEAASPYFEPTQFWLGIKDSGSSGLNLLVRSFLTAYNKEFSTHAIDLYQKKSRDTVRHIIARLDKNNPEGKSNYLRILKQYCYGEMEYIVCQDDKKEVIEKYFKSSEIAIHHPAYQHLFNAVFTNYLTYRSLDVRHENFIAPALRGNFAAFVNNLVAEGFDRDMAELLAVKSFYDGFFSGKYDKKLMLKGIREAETASSAHLLTPILPGIIRKITDLQEGSQAPGLQLKNSAGVTIPFASKGKYVYLLFYKSNSRMCATELDSLVPIAKKLSQVLTIVPVSLDESFEDARSFWLTKKYPWELYGAVAPEKARADFRIKSVPAFYLVAPDQRMLLAPALAPTHNFESLFLKIFRENQFKKRPEVKTSLP